ncbi:hypothetical protein [Methylobacterium sp. OT2]|uniref:hypothetical protein n=1 Tax=Methylobacterium sp. OT2 TaxID=2813779 RepID=UPI00197C9839|nr:hypothetical protein [Methylobacterium sp. OT2]MBN4096040.1 hypothetical protein [Methylobacterium sp. OT2]
MCRYSTFTIATLVGLASFPVLAQDLDASGAGHGLATARSRFTTAVGQTVPRPNTLDPEETGSIQRRTRSDVREDAITRGICIGCGAD